MKRPIAAIACAAIATASAVEAQIFEVIHPDVVPQGFELEVLNGVVLDDV